MKKTLSMLLVVLVLVFGSVGAVRAQEGAYPTTVSRENPYAQGLETAKKAYDDAYQKYQEAAPKAYWSWSHYQAFYRAYYDLWYAYGRYSWYLRAYWWAEKKATFAGTVIAAGTRQPVAGAKVTLTTYVPPYSRMAVRLIGTRDTDARGAFRLDGIQPGKYTYTVEKSGFATRRADLELELTTGSQFIELRQTAIKGAVRARPQVGILPHPLPPGFWDPKPVEGVKVSLFRTDVVYIRAPEANQVVTTGADGQFEFADVPYASVRLVFEKNGFRTETKDLQVRYGTQNLDVVLQYSGPPPPAVDASFDDLNRR